MLTSRWRHKVIVLDIAVSFCAAPLLCSKKKDKQNWRESAGSNKTVVTKQVCSALYMAIQDRRTKIISKEGAQNSMRATYSFSSIIPR